jgi:hypothetical protein
VERQSDGAPVLDSGEVLSDAQFYIVSTSSSPTVQGPLRQSGDYRFRYRVTVSYSWGLKADSAGANGFQVAGIERFRVAEIVGQPVPNPAAPSTHIVITQGMAESSLPVGAAGAKVAVLFDTVGPVTSVSPDFYWTDSRGQVRHATVVLVQAQNGAGAPVNTWRVEWFTDADADACPDGTVVKADVDAFSAIGNPSWEAPPFAAGVLKIGGSVYSQYTVVLVGRD